jgi:hypothetical protein
MYGRQMPMTFISFVCMCLYVHVHACQCRTEQEIKVATRAEVDPMLAELERLMPLCLERGEAARIAETIRLTVGHTLLNCDRNEKRVLGVYFVSDNFHLPMWV